MTTYLTRYGVKIYITSKYDFIVVLTHAYGMNLFWLIKGVSSGDSYGRIVAVTFICAMEVNVEQGYGKMHEGNLYRFCSRTVWINLMLILDNM